MSRPITEYTPPRDQAAHGFRTAQLERQTGGSWIYVGSGAPAPNFTNGGNMGGDWQTLRFRWLLDGGIDIEGVVTGVSPGDVIFTLPSPLYIRDPDGDLPVPGVNIADGSHAAFTIKSNGDVVYLA